MMQFDDPIEMPSEMPDSVDQVSQQFDNPSIKAVNLYQLNDSVSDEESSPSRQIEIDHTLNQSSIENDDFLERVQREEQMMQDSAYHTKQTAKTASDLLLVDKSHVSLTLLESQSAKETLTFTNPTATAIRMRLEECPFQVQTDKMLGFVSAGQLQVVLEPWDRVELVFSIEQTGESYGDLYETVVVLGEFMGRADMISPVSIQFHVRYVSPALSIKYEGSSDFVSLLQGKMAVAQIKGNKIGQHCLELQISHELAKVQINIETRGKITSSMQSTTLYSGQPIKLKLRPRGPKSIGVRERCGLLLRPVNSKICYVLGIQLIA